MRIEPSLADRLTDELLIEAEVGRRVMKRSPLRILTLDRAQPTKAALFNAGTILTMISHGGSEYLDGLANAIEHKNESRTRVYCEAVTQRALSDTFKRRKPTELQDVPVFVDVLYGTAWLAKHLAVTPDAEIALSISVWSGGKLDHQRFSVLQHVVRDTKRLELQAIAILIPPKLSTTELAMVEAVPDDLSELHVKGPSVAWTASSVSVIWDAAEMKEGLQRAPGYQTVVPYYEKYVVHQQGTVQDAQQQVQQQDTKQQQQQEQVQGKQEQMQQQQQQQEQQQQEQQQYQNAQTVNEQQQQQQHQNADGKQEQHQYQNQHQADTAHNNHSGLLYETEIDGGIAVRPIDEERYAALLERIDFESMDATQSVRELLRLRERLITMGLG